MRRGAALGAVDKRGNTAAMLARKQGHVDVAQMLEGGTPPPLEPGASPLADRREADPPRRSPLMAANSPAVSLMLPINLMWLK